jgi:putative peptidoglycan lipid II flippase
MTQSVPKSGRNAAWVAAGILLSRTAGLIRQKLFAHFLGNGIEAAAFAAATRIPNVLQNLLGEGVLSASFIPVYAGLRAQKNDEQARHVAGAVFGLLSVLTSLVVVVGVVAAPGLVSLIVPGMTEEHELTVLLVRIVFPGTGVLVWSAWCLGILNSHKKFFLAYAAPVVWNGCMIAALLWARAEPLGTLVKAVAMGFVLGSVAQFAVQLPQVLRLLGRFSPTPSLSIPGVRQVVSNFVPTLMARGVVQISGWVDLSFASMVAVGASRAVATLTYAQTIAMLPISLFGMAIAAAELPDMSADSVKPTDERAQALRERLRLGLDRMVFFVAPSAVAFLLLGDLIAAALLESGKFTPADSRFVWYVLMGSGVALAAQTSGRLYSSAFYALKDTKTPLRMAVIRVGLGIALGYSAVRVLPAQLGLPAHLGAVFITATTGLTAWLEMTLLKRALQAHIGALPVARAHLMKVWGAAALSGFVTLSCKYVWGASVGVVEVSEWGGSVLAPVALAPAGVSLALLGLFGVSYGGLCVVMQVPQATAIFRRVRAKASI